MRAPFLSSERRSVQRNSAIPGPGQYEVKCIKDQLSKKVWGRQGVFGCTERRFAQLSTLVAAASAVEHSWARPLQA